jgi:hypothetical protein
MVTDRGFRSAYASYPLDPEHVRSTRTPPAQKREKSKTPAAGIVEAPFTSINSARIDTLGMDLFLSCCFLTSS